MSDFNFNPGMTQEEKLLFVRKELLDKIKKQTCRIDELEKEVIRLQAVEPVTNAKNNEVFITLQTAIRIMNRDYKLPASTLEITHMLLKLGYICRKTIQHSGAKYEYTLTDKADGVMKVIENGKEKGYNGISAFMVKRSFMIDTLIRNYKKLIEFYGTLGEVEA